MSRVQHPLSQEDLMAFIDGQMDAGPAARAAAHVESCAACAGTVAYAKRLSAAMAQWEVEDAPDRLTASVLADLRQVSGMRDGSKAPWWRRNRFRFYVLAGSAATLALVVIVSIPLLLRSRQYTSLAMKTSGFDTMIPQPAPAEGGGGGGGGKDFDPVNGAAVTFSALEEPLPTLTSISPSAVARGEGPPVQVELAATQPRQSNSEPQRRETAGESSAPMIIRSARLTVVTKDFDAARAAIDTIVRDSKGYIDALTDHGGKGEGRVLSATLRLPANQLDAGLKELRKIGTPQDESQKSDDVTNQFVDLTARMNNTRNTEQRLLALLRERTGVLKDVLEVETEISRVREQIERMQAQLKNMSQMVAYSTVQVNVTEEYRAKINENVLPSSGTRLRNAGVGGYELAKETVLGVLIFVLQFGPTLLMLAIVLVMIALLIWRVSKRMTAAS